MAKEDLVEAQGVVSEILPDGRFRVRLENEHEVLAYMAGRMRRGRIRTIAGDRVTVELTPYDIDRARIVFREKTVGPTGLPAGRKPQFRRR